MTVDVVPVGCFLLVLRRNRQESKGGHLAPGQWDLNNRILFIVSQKCFYTCLQQRR